MGWDQPQKPPSRSWTLQVRVALVDTVTTPGLASKVMAMKSLSLEAQVMSMAKPLSYFSQHGPFFCLGFVLVSRFLMYLL